MRRQPRWEKGAIEAIPGIGSVTVSVLTASIIDLDRFETHRQFVLYFVSSTIGVARSGDLVGQYVHGRNIDNARLLPTAVGDLQIPEKIF